MKRCFKCGVRKPLSDFHRNHRMADGHLNKCAVCTRKDVAAYRVAHLVELAEYQRLYSRSASGKLRKAAAQRRTRARHPGRAAARSAVARALRDGRLTRCPCERCGRRAQAHHDDYSKPLDVRWLCFRCHRREHGQLKRTGT